VRTLFPAALLIAAAALVAACGSAASDAPHYVREAPAGSDTWVDADALPDWVASPPQRAGYLRFVAEGRSNLRGIAASGDRPSPVRDAEEAVRSALVPAIGDEHAAAAVAQVAGGLALVERACKEEVLTRDPVPGNTLCTAYALWEIAVADVIAPLPEPLRPTAEAALAAR